MLNFFRILHFSKMRNHFMQRLPRILGEKNYILLLSLVVGLIAGLAAVLLRTIVAELHHITE